MIIHAGGPETNKQIAEKIFGVNACDMICGEAIGLKKSYIHTQSQNMAEGLSKEIMTDFGKEVDHAVVHVSIMFEGKHLDVAAISPMFTLHNFTTTNGSILRTMTRSAVKFTVLNQTKLSLYAYGIKDGEEFAIRKLILLDAGFSLWDSVTNIAEFAHQPFMPFNFDLLLFNTGGGEVGRTIISEIGLSYAKKQKGKLTFA